MRQKFLNVRLFVVAFFCVICNLVKAQVTDVITVTTLGNIGISYVPVSFTGKSSSVKYLGSLAVLNNGIKFDDNTTKNVGLVSKQSDRRIKEVIIERTNGENDGTLLVYANESPYSSTEDLYDASKSGTLVGKFVYDDDLLINKVAISDDKDYKYIGIRAANGSKVVYVSSIVITYDGLQADELKEQNMYFTPTVATYDLATSSFQSEVPQLEGNETTVTYQSSDETVATVDADGTVVAKQVGVTVITATALEEKGYKSASASYQLTVVDSESSAVSDACALVAVKEGEYYAMTSKVSSKDANALHAEMVIGINNKVLDVNTNLEDVQWMITASAENNSLCAITPALASETTYLYADAEKTPLKVVTNNNNKYLWLQINNYWVLKEDNTRTFRLTPQNYFKNASLGNTTGYFTPVAMPIVSGYIRETSENKVGTICLPYDVSVEDYSGAEFYSIYGKKINDSGKVVSIYCFKEEGKLEAGKPYIFVGNATSLIIAYSGEKVTAAGNYNGLYGSLEQALVEEGNYLLSNGKMRLCGENCYIQANRAYIKMDEVPEYNEDASLAKRMIEIGGDETVGIEDVEDESEVDVYSINGVLLRSKVDSATATVGLPRGMYIVKGKKVLVK